MEPNAEKESPIRLYIGTPCYGGQVTAAYFTSLLNLQESCSRIGLDLTVLTLWGDALISRARQNITAAFLEDPKATHLLFIDADIAFEPAQVFRLLHFNKDVTAALYPLKRIHWDRVRKSALQGAKDLMGPSLSYAAEWKGRYELTGGFAKVAYAGTGFMLLKRAVLLAMAEKYPELKYRGGRGATDPFKGMKHRYAFFNCIIDPATGQYLPEDLSFCRLWTDMGGEIWADFRSRLDHVGTLVYKGNAETLWKADDLPAPPPAGK